MTLILPQKESSFTRWYKANKETLSQKRKKRYQEDPEYRQRILEASRRHRRGERPLPNPPGAPISFAQAAERTGIGISTLHEWRRKKLIPEPKRRSSRLWFTEHQLDLLKNLKEFFGIYGKRRGNVKRERLREVIALLEANWD